MAKGSGRNRYLRRAAGGKKAGGGAQQQQLADAQAMILKAQQELAAATVEGSAGGGAVRVTMSGEHRVTGVKIDAAAIEADPAEIEMLEDLILAAISDANERVAELQEQSLGGMTGGLNLPGLG